MRAINLYDIAKNLSENHQVCIVHCGLLNDGHRYIDAKSVTPEWMGFVKKDKQDKIQKTKKSAKKPEISRFKSL